VVAHRIFVVDTLDTFYGGVRFFERQNPSGQAHIFLHKETT
jgi:hypothetical protein